MKAAAPPGQAAPVNIPIVWKCGCGGPAVNYNHQSCLDCGRPRPVEKEK